MCKWYQRPKAKAKLRTWLKLYLNRQRAALKHGFCEAWYKKRHITVAQQAKKCRANIARTEKELEALKASVNVATVEEVTRV